MELGNWFPNYTYFIADDVHGMRNQKECIRLLRDAFLLHGLESSQLAAARRSERCREWRAGGLWRKERSLEEVELEQISFR